MSTTRGNTACMIKCTNDGEVWQQCVQSAWQEMEPQKPYLKTYIAVLRLWELSYDEK